MDRLIIIGLAVGLIIYELIKKFIILTEIKKREEFTIEYVNKIVEYSDNGNESDFGWLATNSVKMQDFMGDMGIMSYKPPFANYYINNYLVVVNGIDELRNDRNIGMGYNEHARLLHDSIVKYLGQLGYRREKSLQI